jgi:hypothetical protein
MNYKRIMKSSIIASLIIAIGILAGTESLVKAQGDSELNQQLAQVRAATAKYHDINVAIADGFAPFGNGACNENENGTEGIVYFNLARVQQQGVILEEPELLLYVPSGNGNLRLVAVAYFNRVLFSDTRGIIPDRFPSRLNPLPPYFQEVSGHFTLFNQPPNGPIIAPGLPWFYGLHAWVWSPNPNGMYAVRNPRLNCTGNN